MSALKPRTPNLEHRTETWQRLFIVLLAVAVTIPLIIKNRPSMLQPAPAVFSVLSSTRGYVGVRGDVRHPGIYPITANAMAGSVILMAEPRKAPTAYLPPGGETLLLKSGADILVAMESDGTARISVGSLPTAQRLVLGMPLDINGMTEVDFDRIPGIGPVLARRIVTHRQKNGGLMKVEELKSIEGIGEKKYEHLKKYFN
jgi:competence protein ComEA